MTTILLLTLSVFALAMVVMSIGVLFGRPCLGGSCGGPEVLDSAGEPLSCVACPRRKGQDRAADAPVSGGEVGL